MIKALHGNAALANRRIRTRAFTAADRKWLAAQLAEDDSVVVEPWCERLVDLCATFDVSREGGESGLNLHEVVNTADGAFIGAVFEQRSPVIAPWREAMAEAATRVAERLAGAGYFGPVCVDSFVWQSSGGPRLRRLVDLNARLHISAPILRLWRQLAPHSVAYWRFFTRRKLDLPASYDDLAAALAGDAYEPGAGRGVMLTSPLWLVGDGRPRRPHKLGVLFLDETRDGVLALAYRFRHRFEK